MYLKVQLLLVFVNLVVAFKMNRTCPPITPPIGIDHQKIVGNWYEIQRFDDELEWHHMCGTVNFQPHPKQHSFSYARRQITTTHKKIRTNNTIHEQRSGVFKLNNREQGSSNQSTLKFLNVDFNNYAIVWRCENLTTANSTPISRERLWILSRKPSMSTQNLKMAINTIKLHGLNASHLEEVTQNNRTCNNNNGALQSTIKIEMILLSFLIIYTAKLN